MCLIWRVQFNTSQKYNKWNSLSDVTNHHLFNIDANFSSTLTSNFVPTYSGAIIKNYLLENTSTNGGNIQFKDPWLIDYADPVYGSTLRNQGTNAPFKTLTSPFYPTTGSSYKGVFLNQSGPPLWNPPYYSVNVTSPQSIFLSSTGKTHNFYFQNWSGTSATFQNANAASTGVVFTSGTATVNANLKGTQLSNNVNAYANNSQRKFVRTPDGYLHNVYESMNRVWYETSSNGGSSWLLRNSGLPLDNGEGKSPSIDYVCVYNSELDYYTYWTVIAYHEKYGSGSKVKSKSFMSVEGSPYNYQFEATIATLSSESYSNPVTPVISVDVGGDITWVWKQSSGTAGLYCRTGHVNIYSLSLYGSSNVKLTGTASGSNYPAITVTKRFYAGTTRHLAWEENKAIKYSTISGTTIGTIATPSTGNGYNNYKPSISFYFTSSYPAIAWIVEHPYTYQKQVQLKIKYTSTWSQFWTWGYGGGNDVNSANINCNYDGKFVLAWGGDLNDQYLTSQSTTNVYNLSTYGDVQVSNAETSMGDMKINSFDKTSSVYDFTPSAVTNRIYKTNGAFDEVISKGYSLTDNNSIYMFDFGGVEVDGNRILFNDSFEEKDSSLSSLIESEIFALTDNSNFNFKVNYYSNTNKNKNAASINFKVVLVDVESGLVLKVLKQENIQNKHYQNIGYTVNTNGIGNRTVKLKLEYESNKNVFAVIYSAAEKDSSSINKKNYEPIAFSDIETIKDYALSQNYPNPFNPSTIINYQIPKDGLVSLKVFDVLGKEVATLVDEFKSTGRYNVSFNAGELASGIYLYQLKVNDFVSTKKLVLLK